MNPLDKKPLSKERREEIERDLQDPHIPHDEHCNEHIEELLAAEAYWREAVKNFSSDGTPNNSSPCCQFCDDYPPDHKPDCPWILANQE